MALRNQIGAAILRRKRIYRNDGRERNHAAWMGQVMERIIAVKWLRRFARIDLDTLRCGEQKIGQQKMFAQGQHARIEHNVPKHLGARH